MGLAPSCEHPPVQTRGLMLHDVATQIGLLTKERGGLLLIVVCQRNQYNRTNDNPSVDDGRLVLCSVHRSLR